jgi:hypothetical protein
MEEEGIVASMRSTASAESFTDVVSDLEAHKAKELSLTLQNERLRSILRAQTSLSPPISPRQNAECSVRILSNGGSQRANNEGKLIFGVHLLTILPLQTSFSVAEYVGYRIIESVRNATEGSMWEKGRAFFDSFFGYGGMESNMEANNTSSSDTPNKGEISWEILWKKSVGTGNLCRINVESSLREFALFELLIKEWATAPGVNAGGVDNNVASLAPPKPKAAATTSLEPASSSDQLAEGSEEDRDSSRDVDIESSLARITMNEGAFNSDRHAANETNESRAPPSSSSSHSSSSPSSSNDNGGEGGGRGTHPRTSARNSFQTSLSMKVVSESALIVPQHVEVLIKEMPDRFNQHKWHLKYSTARDGISLKTLYRRVAKQSPTIMIVKDTQSHVFGVFAPDPWRNHHKFYGTGETFVFKLEPELAFYHWNQREHSVEKRNNFFMFSTDDCIGVGGGGHFALWLDEDLLYGNSSRCKTFDNESLAGSESFQVLNIEVWHLHHC